jgi:Undecaprenyl-phosphate glucose phosphotransferase
MEEKVPNLSQRASFRKARWLGRHVSRITGDILSIFDALVVIGVGLFSYDRLDRSAFPIHQIHRGDIILVGLLVPLCFTVAKSYSPKSMTRLHSGLRTFVVGMALVVGVAALPSIFAWDLDHFYSNWTLAWLCGSVGLMAFGRFMAFLALTRAASSGISREAIAVVGAGDRADRLVQYLTAECADTVDVVGIYDDRNITRIDNGAQSSMGTLNDLIEHGKEMSITKIVIALPLSAEQRLREVFGKLNVLPVDIDLCPDNIGFSLLKRQVGYLGDLPLLRVAEAPLSGWAFFLKSAEDIVIGSIALLLLSPIMLVTAIAIKLDSPGPIFFRQPRYGFNNSTIRVWKFRSMYTDRGDLSGAVQTQRGDPRITRIGAYLRKSSIDELPQLFNVLQGTMSLVGPRPHPTNMRTENLLCEDIVENYLHRHRLKPGITGWAQVNGSRGATTTSDQLERRIELDLYYIENWSLWLDIKIMILTITNLFNDQAY